MKKRKKPVKKGLYQAKSKAEFNAAEKRLLDRINELNDDGNAKAV
jgi:hypothetical protein